MTRPILTALLVLASTVGARAADFAGFVSAWRQDCSGTCSVPAADGPSSAARFSLAEPSAPGEIRVARFQRDLAFSSGEKVRASFIVYFVCPADAPAGTGSDACPTRYLQVQAVLTGDARAFCAASLNLADARPFPVLMCAGENQRRPGERLGVSLSRKDVQAAFLPSI